MDCPARAIEILALNRKAKRFVMRYHVDRYVYCGQCVRNCRFKCLTMNPTEWELAALRPDEFTEYSGKPDDVEKARGMARESQVAQGH